MRWIFVRDIPNAILRGIKLEFVYQFLPSVPQFQISLTSFSPYLPFRNTQERKPVTNSRDTQELLPDAGSEMMRIFLTHEAKTSLLQDYAYYEVRETYL